MGAKRRIIPVFVPHMGCPNQCVFCNQRKISGQKQGITEESARNTIEDGLRKCPHDLPIEIAFYGGSFTAIGLELQNMLLRLAASYIKKGNVDTIRISTRPDAVDRECIARLRSYGVTTVEIGAQSLDPDVLSKSGRGHTDTDIVRACGLIQEGGLQLIIQMMTGLPGDTRLKSLKTAEKICELHPDGVRIYPTVILRDTPLFDMWMGGRYEEHSIEDAVSLCAEIVPLFERNGITVIRVGLNPNEELSGGEAAAGAYHPALGELVRSRIRRQELTDLLKNVPAGASVIISVPDDNLSQYIGQHRGNILFLEEIFKLNKLTIQGSNVNEAQIISVSVQSVAGPVKN